MRMGLYDDMQDDLGELLSSFSRTERKLRSTAMTEAIAKKPVWSVSVDSYEALDYPIIRHTFYGRSQEEAYSYMAAHKDDDRFFRSLDRGSFDGVKAKNAKPIVRKIQISELKAQGSKKPGMLRKDAIRGDFAKKWDL